MNNINRQLGGVLQNIPLLSSSINTRSNFVNFLENSEIKLLTNNSSYGILFTCELINPQFKSPYYSFRSYQFGTEVRKIIFKICPLMDETNRTLPILMIGSHEKKRMTTTRFIEEYQTQLHIAMHTCKFLESKAPFPIYLDTFKIHENNTLDNNTFDDIYTISDESNSDRSNTDILFDDDDFLKLLQSKFIDTPHTDDDHEDYGEIVTNSMSGGNTTSQLSILTQLINSLQNKQFDSLGLFAMEIADEYDTLISFRGDPKYKLYKNIARLELIQLILEAGVAHEDFHQENVLFNSSYNGYYYGVMGKSLVIDFGNSHNINYDKLVYLQSLYDQLNIRELITAVYNECTIELAKHLPNYSWFINIDNSDIESISHLIQLREISINNLKQYSEKVNKQLYPVDKYTIFKRYPKLPLDLLKYLRFFPRKENIQRAQFGGNDYNNNDNDNDNNIIYMPQKYDFTSLFLNILVTIANANINLNQIIKYRRKKQKNIITHIKSNQTMRLPLKVTGGKCRKYRKCTSGRKYKRHSKKYHSKTKKNKTYYKH